MEKVIKEIFSALPSVYRQSIKEISCDKKEEGMKESFPELQISMIVDEKPEKGSLLVFCIPELNAFVVVSKKALYLSCVKVSHQF